MCRSRLEVLGDLWYCWLFGHTAAACRRTSLEQPYMVQYARCKVCGRVQCPTAAGPAHWFPRAGKLLRWLVGLDKRHPLYQPGYPKQPQKEQADG